MAQWSFGTPGHGKGPWDGLGGIIKRMLRQDTIDKKLKSKSRIMKTPLDAVEHIKDRFCTEGWKEKHKDMTINEFMVFEVFFTLCRIISHHIVLIMYHIVSYRITSYRVIQ